MDRDLSQVDLPASFSYYNPVLNLIIEKFPTKRKLYFKLQKQIAKVLYFPSVFEKFRYEWKNAQTSETAGMSKTDNSGQFNKDKRICESMQISNYVKLNHVLVPQHYQGCNFDAIEIDYYNHKKKDII